MKYFGAGLGEMHKELGTMIRKADRLEDARRLFSELHGALHLSEVSGGEENELDRLTGDLEDTEYAVMVTSKDETIAWALWHIARLEDLTMNLLVSGGEQVWNREWARRLGTAVADTGNAMSDDQIMELSKALRPAELLQYRSAVGRRTRQIVEGLTADNMKREVRKEDLKRIREEGGVTAQEDSVWLLDYWEKKDVAGLLLMPPTRDPMLHLNDCCKWKQQIRSKKKFYRS